MTVDWKFSRSITGAILSLGLAISAVVMMAQPAQAGAPLGPGDLEACTQQNPCPEDDDDLDDIVACTEQNPCPKDDDDLDDIVACTEQNPCDKDQDGDSIELPKPAPKPQPDDSKNGEGSGPGNGSGKGSGPGSQDSVLKVEPVSDSFEDEEELAGSPVQTASSNSGWQAIAAAVAAALGLLFFVMWRRKKKEKTESAGTSF